MPSAAILFLLALHGPASGPPSSDRPGDGAPRAARPALFRVEAGELAEALHRAGATDVARARERAGARLAFRDDLSLPSPLAYLPLSLDSYGLTWQPRSARGLRPFADLSCFTDHEGTLLPGLQTWAGVHADLDARTTLGLSASHATLADSSPWPGLGTSALLSLSFRF